MTQQDLQTSDISAGEAESDAAPTADPSVVRETRTVERPSDETSDGTVLRSTQGLRAERRAEIVSRYGGMYWGSDFIGFVVAIFFTGVFLGIVGAVVGAVGFQLHAHVPKIGAHVSGVSVQLGIGALIGSLIAVFLAYFIGGYTAGRMARFDGSRNGVGVVIWTVIVAVVLGIAGAIAGNRFNVASQLHLNIDRTTLTTAGVISLAVTLVVMLLGAALGGSFGARFHRVIDADAAQL
ncbi:MAG TPA: hypothetical protein VKX16_05575 [Chloroflexota bacterium]|nr:hypothetical protein [Chloroflexota bacterium]